MDPREGFEPSLTDSESAVLPLDDRGSSGGQRRQTRWARKAPAFLQADVPTQASGPRGHGDFHANTPLRHCARRRQLGPCRSQPRFRVIALDRGGAVAGVRSQSSSHASKARHQRGRAGTRGRRVAATAVRAARQEPPARSQDRTQTGSNTCAWRAPSRDQVLDPQRKP